MEKNLHWFSRSDETYVCTRCTHISMCADDCSALVLVSHLNKKNKAERDLHLFARVRPLLPCTVNYLN
jgi:hypothetical protein